MPLQHLFISLANSSS